MPILETSDDDSSSSDSETSSSSSSSSESSAAEDKATDETKKNNSDDRKDDSDKSISSSEDKPAKRKQVSKSRKNDSSSRNESSKDEPAMVASEKSPQRARKISTQKQRPQSAFIMRSHVTSSRPKSAHVTSSPDRRVDGRSSLVNSEYYNEKLNRKYSELRGMILEAFVPRPPSQELVDTLELIMKMRNSNKFLRPTLPAARIYSVSAAQTRQRSDLRESRQGSSIKRPTTSCDRNRGRGKAEKSDGSSKENYSDDDDTVQSKKHVTFRSKFDANKVKQKKSVSSPYASNASAPAQDNAVKKNNVKAERDRPVENKKLNRSSSVNSRDSRDEKTGANETKKLRNSRSVNKKSRKGSGKLIEGREDGESISSSGSCSPTSSLERRISFENDYQLKSTSNVEIKAWLKEKNKILRKKKKVPTATLR